MRGVWVRRKTRKTSWKGRRKCVEGEAPGRGAPKPGLRFQLNGLRSWAILNLSFPICKMQGMGGPGHSCLKGQCGDWTGCALHMWGLAPHKHTEGQGTALAGLERQGQCGENRICGQGDKGCSSLAGGCKCHEGPRSPSRAHEEPGWKEQAWKMIALSFLARAPCRHTFPRRDTSHTHTHVDTCTHTCTKPASSYTQGRACACVHTHSSGYRTPLHT